MNTWASVNHGWNPYVPRPDVAEWADAQLRRIVEAGGGVKVGFERQGFEDGVRAFRAIIAAQRSKLNARTDRELAKRTDALGNLYRRAPKAGRAATAARHRAGRGSTAAGNTTPDISKDSRIQGGRRSERRIAELRNVVRLRAIARRLRPARRDEGRAPAGAGDGGSCYARPA